MMGSSFENYLSPADVCWIAQLSTESVDFAFEAFFTSEGIFIGNENSFKEYFPEQYLQNTPLFCNQRTLLTIYIPPNLHLAEVIDIFSYIPMLPIKNISLLIMGGSTIPLTLLLDFDYLQECNIANITVQAQAGAQVKCIIKDTVAAATSQVRLFAFKAEAHSHINVEAVWSGGTDKKNWIFIQMNHAESVIEIKGLYILKDREMYNLTVKQRHLVSDSISNVNIRGIVSGNAQASYNGTITIEKEAAGSQAHQHNKNMLLSGGARVISTPQLEVLQNKVRCSHAAATGKPDPQALLYLQTRSIATPRAQQLLIEGFISELFEENSLLYPFIKKSMNSSVF